MAKLPTLEEWVIALRSGAYGQAKGMLKSSARPNAFCCLGVYCTLAGVEEEKLASTITSIIDDEYRKPKFHKRNLVPGFSKLVSVMEQNELAYMNDRGDSFSEIADFIEAEIMK